MKNQNQHGSPEGQGAAPCSSWWALILGSPLISHFCRCRSEFGFSEQGVVDSLHVYSTFCSGKRAFDLRPLIRGDAPGKDAKLHCCSRLQAVWKAITGSVLLADEQPVIFGVLKAQANLGQRHAHTALVRNFYPVEGPFSGNNPSKRLNDNLGGVFDVGTPRVVYAKEQSGHGDGEREVVFGF